MEKFIYSTLFQQVSTGETNDDKDFFFELNKYLVKEFETHFALLNKKQREAVQKAISGLRGGLSTYLSTPLMSDKNEIEKVLRENVETVVKYFSVEKNITASQVSAYKVLDFPHIPLHRQLVGVMRRLIKNGKTMLANAGITFGKNSGNAFLTMFILDEIAALPIVRMKIDEAIEKNSESHYAIINDCIANVLVLLNEDSKYHGHTVLMNFDGDNSFVERLNDKLAKLLDQFGAKNIILSRRTFHTGFSAFFQLQFVVDLNKQALGSIIMSLVGDDEELEDALTTQGSLIVLEKIA